MKVINIPPKLGNFLCKFFGKYYKFCYRTRGLGIPYKLTENIWLWLEE